MYFLFFFIALAFVYFLISIFVCKYFQSKITSNYSYVKQIVYSRAFSNNCTISQSNKLTNFPVNKKYIKIAERLVFIYFVAIIIA